MNMNLIKTIGTKAGVVACRTGLKLRKVSPELMLAGGIIAGVGAVVTACIATKKVIENKTLEKAHEDLDNIQMGQTENAENIQDPKVKRKESFRVYRHLIFEMVKAYGLPAFLLLLSIGLILGSHGILKKRYVSTTLAYKALDEAFKDYRKRVKDAVGEDKELHFFNGTEESGEVTKIDENGVAQTTKDVKKVHQKKYTPYEFDWNARTAPGNWEANSDYNRSFLQSIQNYANDLLNSRGHIFLNEVLDGIGLKRTRAGAVVGWLKGSGGDDYVDFGLTEYFTDEYSDAHDDRYMNNLHLNFNCDGVIWNKI